MNIWDILNSINQNKKDLSQEEDFNKEYNSFLINRGLSYFPDTILHSNEMNLLPDLPDELKYHYLINIIRPRKRFSKWAKKNNDKDIELVMEYFNYNTEKAKSALSLLSPVDMEKIKNKLNKGG